MQGAAAASTAECTDCAGANHIDPANGSNRWVPGPRTNQTYLKLLDGKKAGEALDVSGRNDSCGCGFVCLIEA